MVKNLSFYSEGKMLKGNLYLPESYIEGEKLPIIVLCHGFGGVKELLLPNYAQKFIENGFAAFTFDYRGFGESEGESGRIVPEEQVMDIRNALSFVSSLPEVHADKIALWGTSLGGANALITAAKDKRVKALSVQITFGNGERNNTSHMSQEDKEKKENALIKSSINAATKNKVLKLPLKKILSDEQSSKFFEEYKDLFPEAMATSIPFLTTKYIDEWKPEEYYDRITVPTLIIGATKDIVNNPKEAQYIFDGLKIEDKKLLMVEATHYDIYVGENLKIVSEEQIKWFEKYL